MAIAFGLWYLPPSCWRYDCYRNVYAQGKCTLDGNRTDLSRDYVWIRPSSAPYQGYRCLGIWNGCLRELNLLSEHADVEITTAQELLTGLMPFHNLKSEPSVIWAIMNNQRPVMPASEECREKYYMNILWDVCNRCWASNPDERMTMKAVSDMLVRPFFFIHIRVVRCCQANNRGKELRKYLRLLHCEDSDEEVSHDVP